MKHVNFLMEGIEAGAVKKTAINTNKKEGTDACATSLCSNRIPDNRGNVLIMALTEEDLIQ